VGGVRLSGNVYVYETPTKPEKDEGCVDVDNVNGARIDSDTLLGEVMGEAEVKSETKAEAYHRLMAEGRWAEAEKFRIRYIRVQREIGRKGKDVNEEAEKAMRERFLPLTQGEIADRIAQQVSKEGRGGEKVSLGAGAGEMAIPVVIPRSWGELPQRAAYKDEVEWVHQNAIYVIEDRPGRQNRLQLTKAREKAPSAGAVRLMQLAARQPKAFDDLVAKVNLGGAEGEGEEEARRERKSIMEIEGLLERMEGAG